MITEIIGDSIPPNTNHAVSVCLPTWEATVGYEESDPTIVNAMTTGYPRFFIHRSIKRLCEVLIDKYAKDNETCLCFPSYNVAKRCREYIGVKVERSEQSGNLPPSKVRILQLATCKPLNQEEAKYKRECKIAVVFVDKGYFPLLKQYWQHSGEIISSRLAEYVLHELFIVEKSSKSLAVPSSTEKTNSEQNETGDDGNRDEEAFIETRFGRNLDFSFADDAKVLIKKRIATKVVEVEDEHQVSEDTGITHLEGNEISVQDAEDLINENASIDSRSSGNNITSAIQPEHIETVATSTRTVEEDDRRRSLHIDPQTDVFLFPSGMASIFTAHRLLLNLDSLRVHRARFSSSTATYNETVSPSPNPNLIGYGSPYKKTVMFGFPYTDTLSILRKFNHTHFLGLGDASSMEDLKKILQSGEQILAVFMEAPSNPLLKMGDLSELRQLADLYGFYIVVDETVGGFVNIDVLPYADIVCSSLTKIFSGDSNVIAGSLVLNPQTKLYDFAKRFLIEDKEYEDCLWCEDALYLERNSRDFVARTIKVNQNTEYLLNKTLVPQEGKLIKKIYYPSLTSEDTKRNFDKVKCKTQGGYGGLFSMTFFDEAKARTFFNCLKLCKGPSLGTNFTLACPYAILAHYQELEEVAKYGVESNLVRVSVGLENKEELCKVFQDAVDKTLV